MSQPIPADILERLRQSLGTQYEFTRELGRGGMGSVFLARDRTLDREVAIKVISPELSGAAAFRQRFLQEARTVARLRHPNIVAVYAAGEAGDLLYFVMEYVPGESLRDLLDREGRVDPTRSARILRQLADALASAHAHGIIHRDIKPENVLLDAESGRAMITDFGVAQALSQGGDERMTGTGFIVGSPRYMSPEQAAGERELDGRSDIYSLGLVGYEMVTGEPAFGSGSAVSIIAKQITEPPPQIADRVSGVPPELAKAIDCALKKDPSQRWQHASEMADVLGGPSGEVVSGVHRVRRRRWTRGRMAAAAIVVVVLAASGLWALTRNGGVPDGVDPRKSFFIAPFDNLTRDPSLQWLREGSVNMLTLNLAEWRDLSVVDYERTLDLLKDEGIGDSARIGLDQARELARKAGVWTTVLGQVMREVKDSLTVTARVYDVASGKQIDVAQIVAPVAADPRGIFDQLSRELLDLADAPEMVVDHAKKTSTSLDAYRAYLAGVRSLNNFDFDSADAQFGRAIEADTTFALAYYKRSLLRGWLGQLGDSSNVTFARQASKYAGRLPDRERTLVNAHLALSEGILATSHGNSEDAMRRLDAAQASYRTLITRDSMDAEVWYGLGDAYFHDPAGGDELMRNRNASIRAFSRTLALDSTLHLAYPHLLALYSAAANPQAGIVLNGDTLISLSADVRKSLGPEGLANSRKAAGQRAIAAAHNWVTQDPDAREAYEALASANANTGEFSAAADAMRDAMQRPRARSGHFAYDIAYYELFAGEPKQALESLNSAISTFPAESIKATSGLGRFASLTRAGAVAAYSGRISLMEKTAKIAAEADPKLPAMLVGPTSVRTEDFLTPWLDLNKAALGIEYKKVRGSVDAFIKKFDRVATSVPIQSRQASMSLVMTAFMISGDTTYLPYLHRWSKGMPGAPESDDANPAFIKAYVALKRGDTATAQEESRDFSIGDTTRNQLFGQPFMEAEVLASIGDLKGAAATYESMMPRRFTASGVPDPRWALYARTLAARGRLYEELGERDKAIENYQRFVDLWADADAALQPQVSAARTSLARLRDASSATSIVR